MGKKIFWILFLFAPNVLAAGHAPEGHESHDALMQSWTEMPLLQKKAGGEGRGQAVVVTPQNLMVAGVSAYSNDIADEHGQRKLALGIAGAALDKPAVGGFHWLAAREEKPDGVRVASTVHYFGERGAKNPTAMFMQRKQELEIIPQPYPREHSRYRANEQWRFLVRFNGQPLPDRAVVLETSNGSRSEFRSDATGVVAVRLPDDFADREAAVAGGERASFGRRGADFVLSVEQDDGVRHYLTSFNDRYGTDAFDQRSVALGVGFTLLGMLGAAPLLRHRKTGTKEEAVQPPAAELTGGKDA